MPNTIRYERGADRIVTLTLDDPDQTANTMNPAYAASMTAALDRLTAEPDLAGVIVTSAKTTFFAGGDLPRMIRATRDDAAELTTLLGTIKRDLRRLETLGRPVVAAINGSALGGGLEIALACHHRIALAAPGSRIGFPEVTLGLLPGAGGVTRTVRMLGLAPALTEVLLTGRPMRPVDAQAAGLIDDVADTGAEVLDRARAWIAANPGAVQPWDRPDYRMPGGTPASQLPAYPALLRKQLKGARLPAPEAILATAVEGAQVDIETAFTVETRKLITLLTGQIAKNLIGALFFDLRTVNGGAARPAGTPAPAARTVAVLGAGMMGAGIAYACARAGLDVIVKDVSVAAAANAGQHAAKLLAREVGQGRISQAEADAVQHRIGGTVDAADLAGADVVIEAVFEDPALKHTVFREVGEVVSGHALLASNTSTLPISLLAEGVDRPADFIGMHFFSPVERMPLVEIVVGRDTGDDAVARAFDLARRIGKTPIVVNDGRGFFTSRVIGRFIDEAVGMVAEGVPAARVEQAALQAGYPTGPLALADEVSLTLIQRIRRQFEAADDTFVALPAHAVVDAMVDRHHRSGRGGGNGFYTYDGGVRGRLWSGLGAFATGAPPAGAGAVPFADLQERLLFAEALDALACLRDGVLRSEADANIGSILGIGFPAWTGGVIRYVRQHAAFADRAEELADRYGSRFRPPADLPDILRSAHGVRA